MEEILINEYCAIRRMLRYNQVYESNIETMQDRLDFIRYCFAKSDYMSMLLDADSHMKKEFKEHEERKELFNDDQS